MEGTLKPEPEKKMGTEDPSRSPPLRLMQERAETSESPDAHLKFLRLQIQRKQSVLSNSIHGCDHSL